MSQTTPHDAFSKQSKSSKLVKGSWTEEVCTIVLDTAFSDVRYDTIGGSKTHGLG
jgi:hypothetical protein